MSTSEAVTPALHFRKGVAVISTEVGLSYP